MSLENRPLSVIDVMAPLAIGGENFDPKITVMGGIASAAIVHVLKSDDAKSFVDPQNQRVVIDPGFRLPLFRPNGSKRDADLLVLSSDKSEVKATGIDVENVVGDELVVNTPGIRTFDEWRKSASLAGGIMPRGGDRYDSGGVIKKLLSPLAAELPKESLEPWIYTFLRENGTETSFQGVNPANDLVNRLTRTTIIRPRDVAKIDALLEIGQKHPEIFDWLTTGPGSSQLDLAKASLSIRHMLVGSLHLRTKQDPIFKKVVETLQFKNPYTMDEMIELDGNNGDGAEFLFPDLPRSVQKLIVAHAAFGKTPIYRLIETNLVSSVHQKLNLENFPILNRLTK